jgi:hypothetical protein
VKLEIVVANAVSTPKSPFGSRGTRGRFGSSSGGGGGVDRSLAYTWSDRTLRFEPLLSFSALESQDELESDARDEAATEGAKRRDRADLAIAPIKMRQASGGAQWSSFARQEGIVRTNCVDGLDRTNLAQFLIGVQALGQQLFKCGIAPHASVPTGSATVALIYKLYEQMGDRIAQQYAGEFREE